MTAEERALAARLIFHWMPGDPPKDVEWTLRLVAAMFREHAEDAVGTAREAWIAESQAMKHSPGPWSITVTNAGRNHEIRDVDGMWITALTTGLRAASDARVIAGVPEMLELLREAKAKNYGHGEWWQDVCKLLAETEP